MIEIFLVYFCICESYMFERLCMIQVKNKQSEAYQKSREAYKELKQRELTDKVKVQEEVEHIQLAEAEIESELQTIEPIEIQNSTLDADAESLLKDIEQFCSAIPEKEKDEYCVKMFCVDSVEGKFIISSTRHILEFQTEQYNIMPGDIIEVKLLERDLNNRTINVQYARNIGRPCTAEYAIFDESNHIEIA
ncbi:hypothetical protein [Bacillus altitudinis]|uniref:hypothetical protein n=1 Tax=Bacillus altitudinis TaxID=293387 RepID=UPI001C22127F|nr:hypothetical protein [Bacillus altitudinis]MBU8855305.1 hypothetical protein [Bacillus sp. FJAT-26377]MCY7454261.1 hypothetical protein [Bacillus altitudinis]